MELDLITGRTLNQGRGLMVGKLGSFYQRNVAVVHLNTEDLDSLSLAEDGLVRLGSENGEVVVKAVKADEDLPRGLAFMPYGPWASRLTGPETDGTGMPTLKGIRVTIEREDEGTVAPPTELNEGEER